MKPEQFIREFRLGNVKTLIEKFEKDQFSFKSFDPAADCCFDAGLCMGQEKAWWDICIYDLKRLVESLDLINDLGGMEKLTPYFITTDKRLGYTHVRMGGNNRLCFLDDFCDFIPDDAISIKRVMTAIRDHESIYGTEGASHE